MGRSPNAGNPVFASARLLKLRVFLMNPHRDDCSVSISDEQPTVGFSFDPRWTTAKDRHH